MAYFANGTEGDILTNQCHTCLHGMNDDVLCPVVSVQMTYNYDQLNDGNEDLRAAMNMLIDEQGNCRMCQAIKQAGVTFDLSERDQLTLDGLSCN